MSDHNSEDRWLAVSWDAEHRCIYARWKAVGTSSGLRAGGEKILRAIRARHADAHVSDNRRLVGLSAADQDWFSDTWTPKAVRIGLRRIAVVLPVEGFGRYDSEDILGRIADRDFVMHAFESVSDALDWIAEPA